MAVRAKKLIVISHRGGRTNAPENTMAAFDEAVEVGAPWIELDVQLHADHLWVMHDIRLERTTNGFGRLVDHSPEELLKLDAGNGQKIPLLGDVIERVARHSRINIEIKTGNGTAEAVANLLRKFLDRGWSKKHFLISSFLLPELLEFNRHLPEVPIAVLMCGVPLDLAATASELGARTVNLAHDFATPEMVADAKARGLRVLVYTVNELDDAERLQALGVDGIFTDYPQRFLPPKTKSSKKVP